MKTQTKILAAVTAAALAVLPVAHFINQPAATLPASGAVFTWRIAPLGADCAALTNFMETWAEWKTNLTSTNWTRAYPSNRQYRAVTDYVTNSVTLPFLPTKFFRSAYGFK